MSPRTSWLILIAWLLHLTAPATGHAQAEASGPLDPRELVERALASTEGVSSFGSVRVLSVGTRRWRGQGREPSDPVATLPFEVEQVFEFDRRRYYSRQRTFEACEPYFEFRQVLAPDDESFVHIEQFDVVTRVSSEAAEGALARRLDGFPAQRSPLLEALAADSLWRVEERSGVQGETDVVGYVDARGDEQRLIFDSSGRLRRKLGPETDRVLGTYRAELRLDDYREVEGVPVPFHTVNVLGLPSALGEVLTDELRNIAVTVDWNASDALFAPPANGHPRRPDGEITVTTAAGGVFLLENVRPNYNALAIELVDYVMVVDAPGDDAGSAAAIAAIQERVGNKPIRYMVASHFHYDHVGGAGAYAEAGATLVVSSTDQGFAEELLSRRTSDRTRVGRPAVLGVEGKWWVSDGERRIEIYEIGPNPHVESMLVVYLPEERILYVADVASADWGQVRPVAIPETIAFADRMTELGLDPLTILPAHGPPIPRDIFDRSVEAGRQHARRRPEP